MSTPGPARGAISLTVWQQVKEAAVPILSYWALLLFCFFTFVSVVFGTEGMGTDNIVAMAIIAVATLPAVAAGQLAAFLRVRGWLIVLFSLGCWLAGFGVALAFAQLGELVGFIALFLFVFPIALTGGLWSIDTHRAVWSIWLPVLFTSASVIIWSEAQGNDAQWFAGNKWAIWDLLTLAVLGLTVVMALVYLVSRETHRLALWRRGPTAPLAPTMAEKGAARPRITPLGMLALLVLAGAMTVGTAVIAPYLWRTGPGDRPRDEPIQQPQQEEKPDNGCDKKPQQGEGTPPPEGQDGAQEMMQKAVEAAKKAAGSICTILTLALLAVLGALVFGPPLRRLFVVRHLREPFWRVTPTTRIEQGWRLVEIAMADAGVPVRPGEDARGLAVRARPVLEKLSPVEVHGLEEAADVADRVRFGLGVGPKDVEVMERFSGWAYDTVWERLGDREQLRCMYRGL